MEDPSKSDYSLMKMLLSAPVANAYDSAMEGEIDVIQLDHCYAKPWNWRPETSFMRPSKTLFINNKIQSQAITIASPLPHDDASDLDVVDTDPDPEPVYDIERSKRQMDECENYARAARLTDNDEWEDNIIKDTWNSSQHKIFSKMIRIIQNDRLGRLVYTNSWNEPVLRRAVIDKSAKRTRYLLSSFDWEPKLIQWLHNLLVDNLNGAFLSCYLDILQTLKSKFPTLVDKMMFGPNATSKIGLTSNESLFPLLKRSWDPVAQSLMQHKAKKLPGNPVLLIVPSSPNFRTSQSRRLHNWITLLGQLSTVIVVHTSLGNSGSRLSMTNCLDQMVVATRAKLQEIRNDYPGRPIVLVGINTGGALACQIAEMEAVNAVVSLGFPLCTVEGPRGEPDDMLMELQVPVLFVIGQCALTASPADVEDLREHMRVETGLIIVGSADDYLRVSMRKRKMDGITQSMVDRCIVDEIGDFVGSILISPFPPQLRQSPVYTQPISLPEPAPVKKTKGVKRRASTGSETVDSEPPSPQPKKIPRPVGRPPKDGKYSKAQKLKMQQAYQTSEMANYGSYNHDIPMNNLATCGTPTTDPNRNSPSLRQHHTPTLINTMQHQSQHQPNANFRSVPKHHGVMSNNPIVRTVNKILSTADALRNSNTIDVVNEAVANILQPTNTIPSVTESFIPTSKYLANAGLKTNQPRPQLYHANVMDQPKVKYLPKQPRAATKLGGIHQAPHQKRQTQIFNTRFKSPMLLKPPVPTTINETLIPAPADLTGTNILDIPIIFDDGSLLASDTCSQPSNPIVVSSKPAFNKVVLINKQNPQLVSYDISQLQKGKPQIITSIPQSSLQTQSRSSLSQTQTPLKYTKIILAKRPGTTTNTIYNLSPISSPTTPIPQSTIVKLAEIPQQQSTYVKLGDIPQQQSTFVKLSDGAQQQSGFVNIPFESVDVEQQIKASTLTKPVQTVVVNAQSIKNKPELKSTGLNSLVSDANTSSQEMQPQCETGEDGTNQQ